MSDPQIRAIRSEPKPVRKYDVVLRNVDDSLEVQADYIIPGSHWVEFYRQGQRIALFPAASIGHVMTCEPEGNVLE